MHYANGRAAKAGDLVRGKGYNVKHEIIGVLVYANPGSSACNCQVAHVDLASNTLSATTLFHPVDDGSVQCFAALPQSAPMNLIASIEYGQLDAFVAIDRATGEVLPPEVETAVAEVPAG
jgi:hypothetical protein